jgi:hypothetical protein
MNVEPMSNKWGTACRSTFTYVSGDHMHWQGGDGEANLLLPEPNFKFSYLC